MGFYGTSLLADIIPTNKYNKIPYIDMDLSESISIEGFGLYPMGYIFDGWNI